MSKVALLRNGSEKFGNYNLQTKMIVIGYNIFQRF
ncbi:hypothetical protein C826_00714 [Helicobacter bilis WiWa]|uniref:Uncharacterized protein n=1 Tax=Helicobacter bilis WiWa TaxID=1235804 RepID=N2BDR6_9HELI|nr:hypothetical protein C826_00714 [Helicobacter bilis WiWa]